MTRMEARAMRHTSLRTHPVSMHLRRHRDFLERRCCAERGLAAPVAGDCDDESELSPLGRLGHPGERLPFQTNDEED